MLWLLALSLSAADEEERVRSSIDWWQPQSHLGCFPDARSTMLLKHTLISHHHQVFLGTTSHSAVASTRKPRPMMHVHAFGHNSSHHALLLVRRSSHNARLSNTETTKMAAGLQMATHPPSHALLGFHSYSFLPKLHRRTHPGIHSGCTRCTFRCHQLRFSVDVSHLVGCRPRCLCIRRSRSQLLVLNSSTSLFM